MLASEGRPQSLIIASEPLTADTSTWLEVPEYSLLCVERKADGLSLRTVDLDA
jgi:glutamine amidotransferase